MRKTKRTLNEEEQNIIINSLFEWKNARTREGKSTDPIDDLLIKLFKTTKRIKI